MSTAYILILLFAKFENTAKLPPGLLSGLCYVESKHKTHIVNRQDGLLRDGKRAEEHSIGVCQIKLKTAQQFEPNITYKQLLRPENNIRVASEYLRWQLDRYDGDVVCSVAAYNGGACRYNRHGKIKNRKYVSKVFEAWVYGK